MSSTFSLVKKTYIDSLDVTLQEYVHQKTKAKHFHLACDDTNNAFLVAFLTVPSDSTGVAHILEHTVLCGSKNYPVRDPFFMMIRRSLNTFMNAFTSSDWTAYPFASQNKKDFYNLLNVYLDAAFFPNLNYLDFRQEGHRFEFEEPQNPDSPLVYKGVVFNEMKGSMSSINSFLYQEITKHLFPTTTYHFNSGGDPKDITALTHEALKEFHAKHYHPSNSIFMTYGNMAPEEHQRVFEEKALRYFDFQDQDFSVPDEKRYTAPIQVASTYPLSKDESLEKKNHVINAWLLNPIHDPYDVMRSQILAGFLLDNASSPLRYALESSELGSAPSAFCGLEDSTRELFFACGLEGAAEGTSETIDALITETLRNISTQPINQSAVESTLHQIELSAREITGSRYPYGLKLMLDCLAPELHGGSALSGLAIDDVLRSMREEIKNPAFIPTLINRLLLNNPHKLTLTVKPSHTLADELVQQEKHKLAGIKDQLSEEEKTTILRETEALKAYQNKQHDVGCLPEVTRADVPRTVDIPMLTRRKTDYGQMATGAPRTNGMVYQSVVVDLPKLSEEEIELLPYLEELITEVGCGKSSYLEQQAKVSAVTGGLSANSIYRAYKDPDNLSGFWVLSGKALVGNHVHLTDILKETLFDARFDETRRIQELLAQMKVSREESIIGNGHMFAMGAASQHIAPLNYLDEQLTGMQSIYKGRILEEQLKDDRACQAFGERLAAVLDKIRQAPYELMVLTNDLLLDEISSKYGQYLNHNTVVNEPFGFPYDRHLSQTYLGWAINAPVHYCAKSYRAVSEIHQDAPALHVLAGFLKNGYLHRAIREQGGAYGGGASYHAASGAFNFFSYRDPRQEETLNDFDAAVQWMLTHTHEVTALEEAILGVIGMLDKPSSPAKAFSQTYMSERFGKTAEARLDYRARVLAVTLADLQRVTETYLAKKEAGHIAVLGPKASLEQIGLEIKTL